VVAGIVTGRRTVITKAKAAMAIVTLEDLQGSVEVVVFPRLFEQTGPTWRDGAILLVAGRVDHKGEEISLLADLVSDWDDASAAGPDSFARQVAAGDRGSGRRVPAGGNGAGYAPPPRFGPGDHATPTVVTIAAAEPSRPMVPVGPGPGVAVGPGVAGTTPAAPLVPYVSPRRGGGSAAIDLPSIAPAEPMGAHVELPGGVPPPDDRDEPAVPDEARARIVADAIADEPLDAGPNMVLHVKFAAMAATERVVGAMETFRAVLRDRPGETRVVIHVPGPGGGPMELRRRVAYDAELLAEIRRRLGEGIVEVHLASA
jgi:OB-fold nucleic acid binding protein